MIIEQCGTIDVKGHSVEREGDHRTKTYELFYGVLNKNALTPFNTSLTLTLTPTLTLTRMVPPHENVVAVDTSVEVSTDPNPNPF